MSRRESGGLGQVVSDLQAAQRGSSAVGTPRPPLSAVCDAEVHPECPFLKFYQVPNVSRGRLV